MKTLGKLSSFAAIAGLSAMLTMPVVPAQAQISPEGSNALVGAGIGALAGGVLGHGNIGPVLGGAAAGAVIGALATPHYPGYYNGYYDYRYGYPYGTRYSYGSSYYPYTTYSTPYYGSYYPYSSYGYGYSYPYGY